MKRGYLVLFVCLFICLSTRVDAQLVSVSGRVLSKKGEAVEFATVGIKSLNLGTTTDASGYFNLQGVKAGNYQLTVSYVGYNELTKPITLLKNQNLNIKLTLTESSEALDEVVVVSGTLKEVNILESPVPVEVYNPVFFKKNPTPNLFDALQNINGVRPQLNCNVCNTGDIHINGLEGPYTMVLIDGMPIVSSLSTVYGLSGIPNSLIERMEVVKGPASSLYGSEAIGGLINIITKNPKNAPLISADFMGTSWQEYNTDLAIKLNAGSNASSLTGINYYHFDNVVDNNRDNFTDVTLQQRISIFQKWNINRKDNKIFTVAGRYFYEDRWGGELDWNESFRGSSEVYGESIYTKRWEFISTYQLPTTENILLSLSFNDHDQNSFYGDTPYLARQKIGFGQLTWDKKMGKNDFLLGTALRYTFYDDNTTATSFRSVNDETINNPSETFLPGVFIQNELAIDTKHKVLGGLRYDYHSDHGSILTPRLAYKWSISDKNLIRINMGTGFRVVNLFSEDHAALTGARDVIVTEQLAPERSYNINVNYIRKMYFGNGGSIIWDASTWYTYFSNLILPDYDTNPNQIIYDNLNGFAVTKGVSLNSDITLANGLSARLGATVMDVSTEEEGVRQRQILTERFTGTWSVSYHIDRFNLSIDYTGNVYGSMRLPLLSDLDPRSPYSPTWSIQNIQFTYTGVKKFEIYAGIKNLLNWTPNKGNPFLIARSDDPFDNRVEFANPDNPSVTLSRSRGDEIPANFVAVPSEGNPYALTFDPTYVYAPNQGIRGFLGIRYSLR